MANTTNLDLVKPAGTDHALISVLNSNSDKIDAFAGQTNDSLSAEQNGLAYIVGNTNTTGGTLAVGQFVYVKGHSTIAEGLRKVTSSISANGSITTSNTDACSEGGLNALNSKIAKYKTLTGTFSTTINSAAGSLYQSSERSLNISSTGITNIEYCSMVVLGCTVCTVTKIQDNKIYYRLVNVTAVSSDTSFTYYILLVGT